MRTRKFMTTTQLAEMLQLPEKTLAHWRTNREGPTPQRFGKHVRYLEADVDAWLEQHRAAGEDWMAN